MNLLNMLQVFTTDIMDNPLLTGSQQEQQMIQVLDLCHFIDIYKSLEIIDYRHQINIIEEDGIQHGIYFCDLLQNTKYTLDRWFYNPTNLKDIRSYLNIQELWFVIVVESFTSEDLTTSKEFVKRNNVDSFYDKIFYFNFSQSIIKILK